jgi:hypothetical protein
MGQRRRFGGAICIVALLWFLPAAAVRAGDWHEEPFDIRLWLALSRAVNTTDVIAREASVAYPSGSADNPAGLDWVGDCTNDPGDSIGGGFHNALFSSGAWIGAFDVHGFVRPENLGSFALGYVHLDLFDGATRQGTDDVMRNDQLTFTWSKRLDDQWSIGTALGLNLLTTGYDDTFLGFPRHTADDSIGEDVALGVRWQPDAQWMFGLTGTAGWTGSSIEGTVHLPPPPFGPGDVRFSDDVVTRMTQVKAGAGWYPWQPLGLFLDAQYLHFDNHATSIDVGRFYFGAEYTLAPSWRLLAGTSLDLDAEPTASAGVIYCGGKRFTLRLAYQFNFAPELRHEFGYGHLVSLTATLRF